MDEKQKAREYAVETIAHLASCAPSAREGFWTALTEVEIEKVQVDFYDRAEKIVVQIEEGKSDPSGFSQYLYSNPLLSKASPSKRAGAIKDMKEFFTNMSERIKRSIIYAGSDINVPDSDPVGISEDMLRRSGINIDVVKRQATEKRQAFMEQIKQISGDVNA